MDNHHFRANKFNVLGVPISAVNIHMAATFIEECILSHKKGYVTVVNVHSIMESQRDGQLKRIHQKALMCTPDGMPLVWLGRYHGFKNVGRVYGPDLMLEIVKRSAEKGYTHFLWGGGKGVPELLRNRLTKRFSGLRIVGAVSPPFRPFDRNEEDALMRNFDELSPDITWVGLGCPKQEKWMASHIDRLNTTLMVGVGAAFNFHTGTIKQAPAWMRSAGLEWFFRLCVEPRRLYKRYLINNPLFIWNVLRQLLKLKKYDMPN